MANDETTKADVPVEDDAAEKASGKATDTTQEATVDHVDADAAAPEAEDKQPQPLPDGPVEGEPPAPREAIPVDPIFGSATSALAATGGTVHVPSNPDEIAQQATALGNIGDHSTGGYTPPAATTSKVDTYTRLWSMDNDHTEANRNDFDPLKPDCVTVR